MGSAARRARGWTIAAPTLLACGPTRDDAPSSTTGAGESSGTEPAGTSSFATGGGETTVSGGETSASESSTGDAPVVCDSAFATDLKSGDVVWTHHFYNEVDEPAVGSAVIVDAAGIVNAAGFLGLPIETDWVAKRGQATHFEWQIVDELRRCLQGIRAQGVTSYTPLLRTTHA